jgi:hypothetical protein
VLQCRLATAKLASSEDALRESVRETVRRAIKACLATPLPFFHRLVLAAWFVAVAVAPRSVATWLIALRFIPIQRPSWFERLVSRARAPRGSPQPRTVSP